MSGGHTGDLLSFLRCVDDCHHGALKSTTTAVRLLTTSGSTNAFRDTPSWGECAVSHLVIILVERCSFGNFTLRGSPNGGQAVTFLLKPSFKHSLRDASTAFVKRL